MEALPHLYLYLYRRQALDTSQRKRKNPEPEEPPKPQEPTAAQTPTRHQPPRASALGVKTVVVAEKTNKRKASTPLRPLANPDTKTYLFDNVLEAKVDADGWKYLVKCKQTRTGGTKVDHPPSWEPESNIDQTNETLKLLMAELKARVVQAAR